MTESRNIRWPEIEAEYVAGVRSLRDIAKEFGITEGAIRKRAKRNGLARAHGAVSAQSTVVPLPDRSIPTIEADDYESAGYVYGVFFELNGERIYKVGLSLNPNLRAADHQTSIPFDLRIGIAYYVPNMRAEERALHAMFAGSRLRGEWFKLTDGDLNAMAMRSRLV